ncbi:toxin [Rickettsia rhipicephali]|uniref:type II toxin-antitoxin system VapC family toxin n=1 Tax=Rickettsia rhipicephali TaxID=33992 RepID=UPI00070BC1E6|nr:type II toxin-antitoxin system VapC family toxin [Rickettsia rhipicephali]ALN41015.1 toxin [Rickettsia rhipicephali]
MVNSKPFIANCSITVSWFFYYERDKYSDFTLDYCYKFRVIVPPLWKLEVTNVILIAEKRARIKSVEVIKIIDFLNALPLNISNFNFSIHEGLPMTTNDKALIKACHNNGIPLLHSVN